MSTDQFEGFPKKAKHETVFFTRSEYLVGLAVFAVLLATGWLLHLNGPKAGEMTYGGLLMSLAVIPTGLVMVLMERRRTDPKRNR